jgi:hypothetical protein
MKAFLNRVKAKIVGYTVVAAFVLLVATVLVLHPVYVAYSYVKNKVRGAFSWIANKYNSFVAKFKEEVSEETSQA